MSSLMRASEKGHVGVVKVLLENNANKHTRDIIGVSALDFAKHYKHYDIVSPDNPEEQNIPLDPIIESIKRFQQEHDIPEKSKPSFLSNFSSPKY